MMFKLIDKFLLYLFVFAATLFLLGFLLKMLFPD